LPNQYQQAELGKLSPFLKNTQKSRHLTQSVVVGVKFQRKYGMIQKIRMITLLLLSLFSLSIFAATPQENESIFSINLPDDWSIKEQSIGKLVLGHKDGSNFVITEPNNLPKNTNINMQLKMAGYALVAGGACAMKVKPEGFTASGKGWLGKGFKCLTKAKAGFSDAQSFVLVTQKQGRYFNLVLFSTLSDWESHKDKYLEFFNSWNIKI
jgi:hypothetical protein